MSLASAWHWERNRDMWFRLVLRQAMTLSVLGVIIGVAASFAAAPLLAELLYGVTPHDGLTLLLVSSLLIAVTFLASYIRLATPL